jgi:hypothetical protein
MRPIDALLNDYNNYDITDPGTASNIRYMVKLQVIDELKAATSLLPVTERAAYLEMFRRELQTAIMIRSGCKRQNKFRRENKRRVG